MSGSRPRPSGRAARAGRVLGLAVQALVLGTLLAAALAHLAVVSRGAAVFRYEGF
jgi:hypothetical protein